MKSIILASIDGGSTFSSSVRYIQPASGGTPEDDSSANSTNRPVGADGTISHPQLYVTANSLGSDMDFELYKNDVATGCKVTVLASGTPTGHVQGTGTVSVSEGDELGWRNTSVGTGSCTVNQMSFLFDSDDSSAVTLFGINNASSTNLNNDSSTSYFKPVGARSSDLTEANAEMQCPIAGTLSYFYVNTGTVSRTTTCTAGVRDNNADGNQSVDYDNTTTGKPFTDSTNTDTITARDELAYYVTNGTGSGEANNIEKIGSTLVNTSGLFALINGVGYRLNQNDGITAYYALAGNLSGGAMPSADAASYEIPTGLTFNLSELVARITDEIMTDDSTLDVMVDTGSGFTATGTGITISGSGGAGYHYQAEDIDLNAGDKVCLRCITGASGTRIRIGYFGAVMSEVEGGGGGTTLGLASEACTAFGITAVKTAALSQATETDTAQAITSSKSSGLGLALEADTAHAVSHQKQAALTQALETDTAHALAHTKAAALSLATEADTAHAVGHSKAAALGLAEEIATGLSLTHHKAATLGLAGDTAIAFPVTQPGVLTEVLGLAVETAGAFGVSHFKQASLGLASSADTSNPVTSARVHTLGLSSDNAQAFPLSQLKTDLLGQAPSTDLALPISWYKRETLGRADDVSQAFPLSTSSAQILGQAWAFDTAFSIDHFKRASLGFASDSSSAFGVEHYRSNQIGLAHSFDTANGIAHIKIASLALAEDFTTAFGITVTGGIIVDLADHIYDNFYLKMYERENVYIKQSIADASYVATDVSSGFRIKQSDLSQVEK